MSEMTQATSLSTFYSYGETTGSELPVGLCFRDNDNFLGAQVSILFYFIFLFSLFGNGLVLVIIYRFEKLTTVTNILLLNLVLSSLIFMSSLPFWAVYLQLTEWIFGRVMCKLVSSIYYLGFYSSVLFLALMTFDRHLAVVYSLGAARIRTRRYALGFCAVVWLLSGLACITPMILHDTFLHWIDNKIYCGEYSPNLNEDFKQQLKTSGLYIDFFFFYIFPLAVIVYCYVRIAVTVLSSKIVTKFKTVRLIFVLVLLFFMCWSPYNILVLVQTLSPSSDCEEIKKRASAKHILQNITYLYFCISPFFYTFVGKKFQKYFRKLLAKRFPQKISVSQSSRTNMSTRSTRNEMFSCKLSSVKSEIV